MIWVAREIFDSGVGLWAGAVAAVSPIHIYYSQEARAYVLLTLALALTYGSLWCALRTNAWRWWVLVAASALLALTILALLGIWVAGSWGDARVRVPELGKRKALLWLQLFIPLALLWVAFGGGTFSPEGISVSAEDTLLVGELERLGLKGLFVEGATGILRFRRSSEK